MSYCNGEIDRLLEHAHTQTRTYLMGTEPEQVRQKLFPQALVQFSGAQILRQNKLSATK